MAITITEMSQMLNQIASRANNIEPLLKEAGEYMVNTAVPQAFRDEGPNWRQAIRMPDGRKAGQILSDSGRLKNSTSYQLGTDKVTINSNLPYSVTHQFGSPPIPIEPHREFMTIPQGKYDRPGFKLIDFNTRLVKLKNGNMLAVLKYQKGRPAPNNFRLLSQSPFEVVAILVKKVNIPQRQFVFLSESGANTLARRFNNLILTGKA